MSVYDVRSHPGALEPNAYDYIIETLATTETLQHMVHALRPRGTIVLKNRQYQPVGFTLSEIMKKEPVFHVVNYSPFQEALALLATGRLAVDDLAGRFYSWDDYGAVFAWAEHLLAQPGFALAAVDVRMLAEAYYYPFPDHFDSVITATAKVMDLLLITNDAEITASQLADVYW